MSGAVLQRCPRLALKFRQVPLPQRRLNMSFLKAQEVLKAAPNIPEKLLLGPGPSNVPKDVQEAMSKPMLGHLHPEFLQVMDDVKLGVQYMFKTENPLTFVVSGSGHAGMECAIANLVESRDTVLVAQTGIWGERAADMARRVGSSKVVTLKAPLGSPVTLEQVDKALSEGDGIGAAVLFVCYGESSTGLLQPLDGLGKLCRKHNCLLIVDTVAALGAAPFDMEALEVDCVYTGSQKCLASPPGLAPISFGTRAVAKIKGRMKPCRSFYLDAVWLGKYWDCFDGEARVYHHTAPVTMFYGLRQALARVCSEGLENCVGRHEKNAKELHAKLLEIGLELFVENPEHRNPAVTTIKVPEGIDWKAVVQELMKTELIEIAGGLGPTVGKVWRIGLMGENSNSTSVNRVTAALKKAIEKQLN